tara:strand:+ start:130 stop:282 length:153 start_codon:yes stop_codon:yes gene_type:complete
MGKFVGMGLIVVLYLMILDAFFLIGFLLIFSLSGNAINEYVEEGRLNNSA